MLLHISYSKALTILDFEYNKWLVPVDQTKAYTTIVGKEFQSFPDGSNNCQFQYYVFEEIT